MKEKRKFRFMWAVLLASAAIGLGSTLVESITGGGIANYITGWNNSTDITFVNATYNSTLVNYNIELRYNGSTVCTPANSLCNGSGTVNSINISKTSSAQINITPSVITSTGTFTMQFPDATATQSGIATAAQITSLNLKSLAGSCSGYNSTHINVTMNATTAGVQCTTVQYNQTQTYGNLVDFLSEVNNSGTAETSIYNYTVPAGTLLGNGDKIEFDFEGYTNGCTGTVNCRLRLYVEGSLVYDSGAVGLSTDSQYGVNGFAQRINSTSSKIYTSLTSSTAASFDYKGNVHINNTNWNSAGVNFNFTATAGGVGAASNQIVGSGGYIDEGLS